MIQPTNRMGRSEKPTRCYYCHGEAQSIDHVIPRSKGGNNTNANRVHACIPCNKAKADMTPREFLTALKAGKILSHRMNKHRRAEMILRVEMLVKFSEKNHEIMTQR